MQIYIFIRHWISIQVKNKFIYNFLKPLK